MNAFYELKKSLQIVEDTMFSTIENYAKKNTELFLKLQKQQLWDGKTIENKEIHPLHTENSFFKTREDAEKYIEWKESFTKNSKRNRNVPNLFIRGDFYSEIEITSDISGINFYAEGKMSSKIIHVFKNILGFTDYNLELIKNNVFNFVLIDIRNLILNDVRL